MKRFVIVIFVLFGLTACTMPEPEPPAVDYKSKNRITFLYDPLDYYTSAPPEMLDMAEDYCNSLGKTSIETGTRYTSSWTGTEKYWDFECIQPYRTSGRATGAKLPSPSDLMAQQNNMLLRRIVRNQPPPFQ